MNREEIIIAPSVLSADFSRMQQQLHIIESSGAHWVHLDVMDGSFVPDISFGHKFIHDIRTYSTLTFDTHLMVDHPERHIEQFAHAGSDIITIHAESTVHLHRVIEQIHNSGCKAGISIVPSTPISVISELLEHVELVLIMTVNPGYGGQKLIESCLSKISDLSAARNTEKRYSYQIAVDGGINLNTAGKALAAGADVLITGSAFFAAESQVKYVKALQNAL
ncbi:MAG: ribulose-phosphate 3-epimerase [Spirochaetota bacterium]